MKKNSLIILPIVFAMLTTQVQAASKVKGSFSSGQRTILALSENGASSTGTGRKFDVTAPATKIKLYVLNSDTTVFGPVVLGIKSGSKLYSVSNARQKNICENSDSRAVMSLKVNGKVNGKKSTLANLGVVSLDADNGVAYPTRILPKGKLDLTSGVSVDTDCVPLGAGNLGLGGVETSSAAMKKSSVSAALLNEETNDPGDDPDGDGMANVVDIDDDGDQVLDNDDSDSQGGGSSDSTIKSFWVFSNFHNDLVDSLNANAMTLTNTLVDTALRESAGFAIQVVGNGDISDVELDCGSLIYCKEGGTGRAKEPYPDGLEFPEGLDSDSDGFGTVDPGSSSDFQLSLFGDADSTLAASDEVHPGDVLLQRYTEGGKEIVVPGMLNFIFHTSPAVKTVVTGVQTYEVTYPVTEGSAGSSTNCFEVPASGDVSVTLTVWRPQREGIPAAGEASLVDMGNLRLVTNIPNGPCNTDGSNCSNGPGLCASTVYTTSDPNLTVVSDGLQDGLGDSPLSVSNTFTYTINLSSCLTQSGATWSAGQKLTVPIQMMNVYGDNTAQNICFKRRTS